MNSRRTPSLPIRAAIGVGAAITVVAAISLSFADATSEVTVNRLAGVDRFETASLIAMDTFPSAATALIARADQFPDAVASNYLAGALQAPVLLTNVGEVPAVTKQALADLKVKDVVLLGGQFAISQAVEDDLEETNSTSSSGGTLGVRRIGGTDRYETARLIATDDAATVGSVDGKTTALLATGERFPDALAAGPAAYGSSLPTVLTAQAALSPAAKTTLTELSIQQVIILGGTAAVSQAAEDEAEAVTGSPAIRISGLDRTETASKFADYALSTLGFDNTHANLTRGDEFPDALAGGGAHAGEEKTPILLTTDPNTIGTATKDFFVDNNGTLSSIDVFGGTAAVTDAVVDEAKTTATCADTASTTTSSSSTSSTSTSMTTTTLPIPLPTTTTSSTTSTSSTTTSSTTTPTTTTTTPTTSTTTVPECSAPVGGSTTSTTSTTTTTTTP